MCILKITQYFGRNGNNLLHVLNFLYVYENKYPFAKHIYIPPHDLFSLKSEITNMNNTDKCQCNKTYILNDEMKFSLHLTKYKELFNKYLLFSNSLKNRKSKYYDISIHIRSDDIFNTCIHRNYMQPPLYFYETIISNNSNKKIIIISSDSVNPVINALKNKYLNNNLITFQSSNVSDDIKSLSNSSKIIFSNGTFCLIPYLLSETINQVIYPSYLEKNIWFTFDKNDLSINLPNYYEKWKMSSDQLNKMISYKLLN